MKWRTIIWRRMRLQGISTAVFLMLAILSLTLNGSEGTRRSIKSFEDPKTLAKTEEKPNSSSSQDSSTALNSFLENVLKAQDELKWIDQAVRRVGTKKRSEIVRNRHMRNPRTTRRFHSNIRSKRKSGSQEDEEESWPSSKRGNYDENETENLEDEVKRNYYEDDGFRRSRRNQERTSLVDDSTLAHWAQSEGLEVPEGWLNPVVEDNWSDSEGDADDWFENLRDEREARADSSSSVVKEPEEPTLESLRRTVLELRKSLEDSDKKMGALTEEEGDPGVSKNRERHVEKASKTPETSSGSSNWRNDPRSAVDMFDFKRRDDDVMDDEDDDEDSEPGISEFDYMMQRVKRDDENARVYRGEGAGVSFSEDHGRVQREIREAGIEGDNKPGDSNDDQDRKRADIKATENGHSSSLGEPAQEIKTQDKEKNEADDNPPGKFDAVGDEKRSVLDEPSELNSKLNELLKPEQEKDSQEKVTEVEKSETNDDSDVHKLNQINSDSSILDRDKDSGKSNGTEEVKKNSNETVISPEDKGVERKYNKQEESYEEDKRLIGYNDKDKTKFQEPGDSNEAAELGKDEKHQDLESGLKSDESLTTNRKLLWISDKPAKGESKIVEIRDGRRDSSWDQNRGEKSGQRPANYLGGLEKAKFSRRSLMVANDKDTLHGLKKRKGIRSAKDLEPEDNSDIVEKRSMERSGDREKEAGVDEEAYELEDEEVAEDDDEGDDNLQGDSDRDRDPMRDRINMLIKQKLDDRGKGKLVHLKRDVNNIQYYDYDSDANGKEPEADSNVVQNDQRRGCQANSTDPEVAIDKAPPDPLKKDYQEEEETKEKMGRENQKNTARKQEFISDAELAKVQKKKQPSTTERHESKYASQQENKDSRWLGQSEETEGDSKDSGDDQESRDPEELEKPDNESGEIFGEPLEYSVNVHGKLDPESISNILEKGADDKDKETEEEEEKLQMGNEDDWISGSTGSRDQEVERDLEPADQRRRYRGDSARIEEENKDRKYNSQKIDDEEDVRSSRDTRQADDFGQDSLPTMLDRSSGPRQELASGERTYLVIAPNEVKHPEEEGVKNSTSSSRSNYLALKVTDDLFKGGIEQSNPTDDKMDTNSMGRTTTEWRVIKPQDESNTNYDDDPNGQDIDVNPRDVARESFVDREEILGDFDDDARPRFRRDLKYVKESFDRHLGRILQSVSDPLEIVDLKMDWETEKPVEKYLESSQRDFQNSETTVSHRVKRSDDLIKDKEGAEKNSTTTIKSEQSKNTTETPNDNDNDNDNVHQNEVDKDKRGLTNVEEWEMDTPTVQKQHLKKYAKKNADFKNDDENTKESHERETRSLKYDSDRENRLKIRQKFRPRSSSSRANPFAKYGSSRDSSYGGSNAKRKDESRRYWRANREHSKNSHGNRPKNHRYRNKGSKKRGHKISGSKKSTKRRPKNVKRHRSTAVNRDAKAMSNIIGKKSFRNAIDEKKIPGEDEDKTHTGRPGTDEGQKKKFTVLLAADNMEDESQMDLALHGELAGKIVERIYDQVQKNDALKESLGPGLFRKHKSEDAAASDKIYREGLDEDEVKHTEGMMRRVMELLGRLIIDEVQRKTCASLPPDMREFLQWMLGVDGDNRPTDQSPQNFGNSQNQDDNFLFEDPSMNNEIANVSELNKKVKVLKKLIDEYNSLSSSEKTKVKTVHDYLIRQLGLLARYIEAKQNQGSTTQTPSTTRNISQHQYGVPNSTESTFHQSTISPLVGTPSILMLSNASFIEHPGNETSVHLIRPGRRDVRSSEVDKKRKKQKHKRRKHPHSKKHKKHKKKKKKKKKKKHNRHHKRRSQSPEYKKLIRRAAMLRKKRANNLYEDDWNPLDSGYEEPMIYTSSGKLTNKNRRSVSQKEPEERKLVNDELTLLNKREAWKSENEQQLEEVAFGKDMRGKWKEKEEFEKLTEMDKRKNDDGVNRKKREEDDNKSDGEIKAEDGVKNDEDKTMNNVQTDIPASITPLMEEKKEILQVDKAEEKRSVTIGAIKPEVEVTAVLPLMEVSDHKEEQKEASKTEKDDQRDIADQMLGLESPIIAGLNTY